MEHPEKASPSETVTPASNVDWQKNAEVAEQRRRDTQSQLTPVQQENVRLRAENEALQTLSAGHPVITLAPAEQERLDTLKFEDPDSWRKEINTLEMNASKQAREQRDTLVQTKISEAEKKHRETQVNAFFQANTDVTMDEFNAVVPMSLHNKMAANEITVDEYLAQGSAIIRGVPVASAKTPNSPDIGGVAGSAAPTGGAKEKQKAEDWATTLI